MGPEINRGWETAMEKKNKLITAPANFIKGYLRRKVRQNKKVKNRKAGTC